MELLIVDLIAEEDGRGEALCRKLNQLSASSDPVSTVESGRLWEWSLDVNSTSLTCQACLPNFRLNEHGERLYSLAAEKLSEFIVEYYEPMLIKTIIRKQFHYTIDEEITSIEQCCQLVLSGEQWTGEEGQLPGEIGGSLARRLVKIAAELRRFLEENTRVNLQGFITFRLHGYWQELREAVEYAVEEYVMDKQYREFISLLKYFVDVQPSRRELVHVIHEPDRDLQLLDADYQPLDTRSEDRAIAELVDAELNVEDMILSSLITAAPAAIRIHTPHPEHQVVRTIQAIFDQRVAICGGCLECRGKSREVLRGASLD